MIWQNCLVKNVDVPGQVGKIMEEPKKIHLRPEYMKESNSRWTGIDFTPKVCGIFTKQ